MSVNSIQWNDYRCRQLESFCDLLNECRSIDTGNRTLDRLTKIIGLAHELDTFQKFLHDLTVAERLAFVQELKERLDEPIVDIDGNPVDE